MAHITGGGLVDNLPRVLGKTDAWIDRAAWTPPAALRAPLPSRERRTRRGLPGLQHGHRDGPPRRARGARRGRVASARAGRDARSASAASRPPGGKEGEVRWSS
jgi:hypothetical protein